MTISITITDPSKVPAEELRPLIQFLQAFTVAGYRAPALPIAAEDRPDSGAPHAHEAFTAESGNPAAAFAGSAPPSIDPAVAFGAPGAGFPQMPGQPLQHGAEMATLPNGQMPSFPFPTPEQRAAAAAAPPQAQAHAAPNGLSDSAGVRYDERIHAKTKTTNKDGTWKLARGVDQALVAQIVAEQKGAGSYPFQNTAASLGLVPAAGIPPSNVPAVPSLPSPTPAAAAFGAATNASPSDPNSYIGLVTRFQTHMVAGHVSGPEAVQCCMAVGVADLPALAIMPSHVAAVSQQLDALLRHKGLAA